MLTLDSAKELGLHGHGSLKHYSTGKGGLSTREEGPH